MTSHALDEILGVLSSPSPAPLSSPLLERLQVLLTDYLVCVVHAEVNVEKEILATDGLSGLAAALAIRSSSDDRDDIDWSVMTHPGSVIWSVALACANSPGADPKSFLPSVVAGYRTSATIARLLGDTHRSRWHVTSTAGAFGSASTAAVALGLDQASHERALLLAGANAGGIGQAAAERLGAAQFNRAAAASLGVVAALSASQGAIPVADLWHGSRGLLELFSIEPIPTQCEILDGISTVGLRLFPVNGFSQAAVLATATLARQTDAKLLSILIEIAPGVSALVDGTQGGRWWDLVDSAAAAWKSKSPFHLDDSADFLSFVTVTGGDVQIGGALVRVTTSAGESALLIERSPGQVFGDPQEIQWREEKWSSMAGEEWRVLNSAAGELLDGRADFSVGKLIGSGKKFVSRLS
jgi:hypothetical protein